MDKSILSQYSDLKKEIGEVRGRIERTEQQISRIEAEGAVKDVVSGGDGGLQHFVIEGFPYPAYSRKKSLLYARMITLENLEMELLAMENEVEEFIASLSDSRIRRIITLRFLEGKSWVQVAMAMGGYATEDSIRMEFERYMKRC